MSKPPGIGSPLVVDDRPLERIQALTLEATLLKEINKITLEPNEYLIVKVAPETNLREMDQTKKALTKVFGENAKRVLVVKGNVAFTKAQIDTEEKS